LPEDVELHQHAPIEQDGAAPVYPAGDLLTNEGTVTAAIGCGREMALLLHERFSGEKRLREKPSEDTVVRSDRVRLHHFAIHRPHGEAVLPVEDRAESFEEVHRGLEGTDEARRCLSCGVCNACDRCVTYCPDGVLRREGDRIVFDYDYCKGCGVCVSECSRAVIYMKAS
jgi:ferredoxin